MTAQHSTAQCRQDCSAGSSPVWQVGFCQVHRGSAQKDADKPLHSVSSYCSVGLMLPTCTSTRTVPCTLCCVQQVRAVELAFGWVLGCGYSILCMQCGRFTPLATTSIHSSLHATGLCYACSQLEQQLHVPEPVTMQLPLPLVCSLLQHGSLHHMLLSGSNNN